MKLFGGRVCCCFGNYITLVTILFVIVTLIALLSKYYFSTIRIAFLLAVKYKYNINIVDFNVYVVVNFLSQVIFLFLLFKLH